MSKRVLICIGIAVAAIAAAFLFYKQELTNREPEEEAEEEAEAEEEKKDPLLVIDEQKTKGQIFAEKMQAARDAKKQTVGAEVNEQ